MAEEDEDEKPRSSKLNATDRKDFKKAIENRHEALISALNGNLFADKEDLKRDALLRAGFRQNSDELENEISKVENEISDKVSVHIEEESSKIDIEFMSKEEEINLKVREIKERMNKEISLLNEQKALLVIQKSEAKSDIEFRILTEKFPELNEKKEKLKDIKIKVDLIEGDVERDIMEKLTFLRKMSNRIRNAISDAINKAFEDLIIAETRADAKDILEHIPTVADLVVASQNMDGITNLINQMCPKMQVALPPPPAPPPQEAKPVEATPTELKGEAKVVSATPVDEESDELEEGEESEFEETVETEEVEASNE